MSSILSLIEKHKYITMDALQYHTSSPFSNVFREVASLEKLNIARRFTLPDNRIGVMLIMHKPLDLLSLEKVNGEYEIHYDGMPVSDAEAYKEDLKIPFLLLSGLLHGVKPMEDNEHDEIALHCTKICDRAKRVRLERQDEIERLPAKPILCPEDCDCVNECKMQESQADE